MNVYHITLRTNGYRYGDVPMLATFYMQRDMTLPRLLKELRVQRVLVKGMMLDDEVQEVMTAMERTAQVFHGRVEFEELGDEITLECSDECLCKAV